MNRSRFFKKALLICVSLLILLQIIPYRVPENTVENNNDIIQNGVAKGEVADILKASCYDCHSNQAVYPWYSYVAPVSWLIANDVKEGRRELNFSNWTTYEMRRKTKKLEEIQEQVEEGEMPMPIYVTMHGNASLGDEQKQLLIQWTKDLRAESSAH